MPMLNLVGTEVFKTKVIPNAPGDPVTDLGTRRVFSEDLRDKNSNKAVGQHSGTCVLVRQPAWWLCHAGWTLEKVGPGAGKTGNLVAGALLDFNANTSPMAAIFGGTGDFSKARGEITVAPIPNTTPQQWDYMVELVP
jgi:hypothetical protein